MSDQPKKATEEDLQRIKKAIEEGGVRWSEQGREYWDRAGVILPADKADFTVVKVVPAFFGSWEKTYEDGTIRGNLGGVGLCWQTVSAAFGELTIYLTKDGKLKADTECMSKEFCKSVLLKLLDSIDEECWKTPEKEQA